MLTVRLNQRGIEGREEERRERERERDRGKRTREKRERGIEGREEERRESEREESTCLSKEVYTVCVCRQYAVLFCAALCTRSATNRNLLGPLLVPFSAPCLLLAFQPQQ